MLYQRTASMEEVGLSIIPKDTFSVLVMEEVQQQVKNISAKGHLAL